MARLRVALSSREREIVEAARQGKLLDRRKYLLLLFPWAIEPFLDGSFEDFVLVQTLCKVVAPSDVEYSPIYFV